MHHDRYGLALSTSSPVAAAAYSLGLDQLLASLPAVGAFTEAIEADREFALPHAAMARIHQTNRRSVEARAAADRAVILAAGASPREQESVAIQHLLATGHSTEALERIKTHVAEHPTDAFVLGPASSVFGLIGFSGRINREAEQLAFLEPLAGHYGDDWWFQASLGFALVETGRWVEGRALVERALELNPDSAHATHVLAHALYEAGEDDEALSFLNGWMPGLDREASLHCHLWWHLCLLLIGSGESDQAWTLYDEHLAPDVSASPPLNIFTDGTSMGWRSMLAGHTNGDHRAAQRWQALSDFYHDTLGGTPGVFLDAHGALPLVGLGRLDEIDDYVAQVKALDAEGKLPAGSMAVVMSRAFQAYGREQWGDVIDGLEPYLNQVVRIGGSRAQRDLAFNTVLSAYRKAGRTDDAERLLAGVNDREPSRPVAAV